MPDNLTAKDLRKKFDRTWPEYDHNAGEEPALRIYRAISWVERAEKEAEDLDAKFIFYWIAFNAAYGQRKMIPDRGHKHGPWELRCINEYFDKVLRIDVYNRINDTVHNMLSDSIMNLTENRFIFREWWDFHNSAYDRNIYDWERASEKKSFDEDMKDIENALNNPYETKTVLEVIFNRLYIMRNQLMHGGSSWNSNLSRDQAEYSASIMSSLVPLFISVMMNERNQYWGSSGYPRIKLEQLGLDPDEEFPDR